MRYWAWQAPTRQLIGSEREAMKNASPVYFRRQSISITQEGMRMKVESPPMVGKEYPGASREPL